jgi:hypothetical protein
MTAPPVTRRGTRFSYAARMPEEELQQLVSDLCKLLGLTHFHVTHSCGMTAGWRDSVIIGTRIIYRELKAEAGRLTPEQRAIGELLKATGADWKVWRPRDWHTGDIEEEDMCLGTAALLRPSGRQAAPGAGCRVCGGSYRGVRRGAVARGCPVAGEGVGADGGQGGGTAGRSR